MLSRLYKKLPDLLRVRINSLQFAVLLGVGLALAIPGVLGVLFESYGVQKRAEAELQQELARTTNVLAAALDAPLWEFSPFGAEAIVQAVFTDEHIVSIVVTERAYQRVFVEKHRVAPKTDATYSLKRPIRRAEQVIGEVVVTMTLAPYLELSWARLKQQLLQLSAILIAALTTIIIVLRRRLLAPITHLTSDAHLLAAENLTVPITADHDDELGQVAGAMEHMRRRLLESFSQLQQANLELQGYATTLESRVSERTMELTATNQELQAALSSLTRTQHDLVEAEKLASLGRLVAGVAHELNTPIGSALTVITDCEESDRSIDELMTAGDLRRSQLIEYVRRSREGHQLATTTLTRAARIIREFKQLAIDQTTEMRRKFDLATIISEVLTSIHANFKPTPYRIEVVLEEDILMDSFPGPLGQVITNIALNSLIHGFAGREAGTLTISARKTGLDEVRITCHDNGWGMRKEVVEKIFDPFFTTRFGQGGSGLGMHIVYSFVTGILCGKIEITSAPGQGSSFTITLPLIAPSRSQPTA